MKTYWDYTEKERSKLTEDEVRGMLDVELMTNGVLRPKRPALQEIPSVDLGPRKVFFGFTMNGQYGQKEHCGIVFQRIEDAQLFAAMKPFIRDSNWELGSDRVYAKPIAEFNIAAEELYDHEKINAARGVLREIKAVEESNNKLQTQYVSECNVADKITDNVWSDWRRCRSIDAAHSRVSEIYEEYASMAGGDSNLALKFLEKAIGKSKIDAAREWLPGLIPDYVPECAPACDNKPGAPPAEGQ